MKFSSLQLIIFLIFLASCGQDFNSNFNDRGTYADIGIAPGTPLYNSYVILQNKCFSCHAQAWSDFKTNQAWIDSGRVVAGNHASSPLITKLRSFGGDMPPPPNAELTTEEVTTLTSWIDGL